MSKTLNGKKPLSSKRAPTAPSGIPDFFRNKLMVPDDIAADIASKSQESRWIPYKAYVENGNSHDKGWSVYKAPTKDTQTDALLGRHPDGIIRRGDLVLAVRSKEMCDQHRAYLASRAYTQTHGFKKAQADELRQMAKDSDLKVVEGYEENEGIDE